MFLHDQMMPQEQDDDTGHSTKGIRPDIQQAGTAAIHKNLDGLIGTGSHQTAQK